MKNVLLSIVFFLATIANADVVKITGELCQTQVKTKNGSGIIFNISAQQYVLSSEHVTSNQTLCYRAQTDSGATSLLEFISNDWESGLSLFKVNNAFHEDQTTLADFLPNSALCSHVLSIGYPAASNRLLADKSRVIVQNSDRTPLLAIERMIEIMGTQFEFGMSGGALVCAEDKKIMGLISHQRLIGVPGQPTKIIEGKEGLKENHGLVIPSAEVVAWVKNTLQGKQAVYTKNNNNIVSAAGLLFNETKDTNILLIAKAEDSSAGGDGVGIGGESAATKSVEIEVSISALDQFKTNMHTRKEFEWLNRLTPQMLKNKKITVTSVLSFNAKTGAVDKINIKSTAHFIKLLRQGNSIPLIKNMGADLGLHAALRSELMLSSENQEINNLNKILVALIDVKNQYGLLDLPVNNMKSLEDHPGWGLFFADNFELAVKARTFVQRL